MIQKEGLKEQCEMNEQTVHAHVLLLANMFGCESREAPGEQMVQSVAPGEQSDQSMYAV